jgi:lysosomal acid lipase/cholesteryl ester hydrolase
MLQLALKGHPVWMINQRGTEYSSKHETLDVSGKEFWDYSLTDQWLEIKANLETIKAYTGYDDSYYVGYAGATFQMLYALEKEE